MLFALFFSLQGDGAEQASVTSKTLENEYLADGQKEIPFSAGKHQYILHFKGAPGTLQMHQQNMQYKTKREVRRRPRFVSAQDVEQMRYFYILKLNLMLFLIVIVTLWFWKHVFCNSIIMYIFFVVHHRAPTPFQPKVSLPTGTRMPYQILDTRSLHSIR